MKPLRKPSTDDDERRLIAALDEGLSPARTAVQLKRSKAAVDSKARLLGRTFKTICERRLEAMPPKELSATPRSVPHLKPFTKRYFGQRIKFEGTAQ